MRMENGMKSVHQRTWCARSAVALAAWIGGATAASGQVAVTLTANDAVGMPVRGAVEPGSRIRVDIALSIDTRLVNVTPIPDVRFLRFDFVDNNDSLRFGTFRWVVNFTTYPRRSETLPQPTAESTLMVPSTSLITLTEVEQTVATIEVTVNGRGTLNVVGSTTDPDSIGAQFEAGFSPRRLFTFFDEKVSGGTLQFSVLGADRDGDGFPDSTDKFPDDPDEWLDSDGDRIGNNADPDDDNDGIPDEEDPNPIDEPTNADADNDSVPDAIDAFPGDPTEWNDQNSNGLGDNAEGLTNTGPRITGGVCGVGIAGAALMITLTLAAVRRPRRRDLRPNEGRIKNATV